MSNENKTQLKNIEDGYVDELIKISEDLAIYIINFIVNNLFIKFIINKILKLFRI